MQSPRFDYAVIGSSPLLLAMALRLRRAGHSVVLFETENSLGGAWQVEEVGGLGGVECACHLIEWYVGGYEALTRFTGTRFVPSDPQPTRVFRNGKIRPYTSRSEIVRAAFRAVLAVAITLIRLLTARAADRSVRAMRLVAAWDSFRFFMRFRFAGIFTYSAVCRPEKGYTAFVDDLCHAVRANGVAIVEERVTKITDKGDLAVLNAASDQEWIARRAIVGESSRFDGVDDGFRDDFELQYYYHIVISFPESEISIRSDYVHFPDDPLFHRITYVGDRKLTGEDRVVFLIQLRCSLDEIEDFDSELESILRRSKIAKNIFGYQVHGELSKEYMHRIKVRSVQQKGNVIWRIRTIGDLSRNLMLQVGMFESFSNKKFD